MPSPHIIGADGTRYPTPDIPTVDKHLTVLTAQLRAGQGTAAKRTCLRYDVDRLLEARQLLRRLQDA